MIYVHVPFCRSFCTYCDFYSEKAGVAEDFEPWASGICREASQRREEILSTLETNTLYIGGGTPSVLPLDVLRRVTDSLPYGPFTEFTVEVNPEDIVQKGPGYAAGLRSLGVNRISMGVQSLDDGILRWMNRRHDSARALEAFRILREAGFGNISVDVIFGISQLRDELLQRTLDGILALRPEHISAYQLSIEEGSALCTLIRQGKYTEAPDEQCRRQYELICSVLREAGYNHYEISNWALPGREAVHNSAYWTRAPYVGLGPGAHSLRYSVRGENLSAVPNVRSWNSEQLTGWTSQEEHLSPEEIREETLMLGLRTSRGACGLTIPEKDWFISDSIISELI